MTPESAAKELLIRAANLKLEVRSAEKDSLQTAYHAAQMFSSGPYKLPVLAMMGHPYAKRDPRPPADPGEANVQSGDLLQGWRHNLGRWSQGGLISRLFNVSPHAVFFDEDLTPQGTPTMIAHPMQKLIRRQVTPIRLSRLERAMRKALKL